MKSEENKTFQKDIDDIYENFIRAKHLLRVVMDSIQRSANISAEDGDALDAAVDYFNRLVDDFDAVVNPIAIPSQEVSA